MSNGITMMNACNPTKLNTKELTELQLQREWKQFLVRYTALN